MTTTTQLSPLEFEPAIPTEEITLDDIARTIQERAIHTVEIGFADIPGVLRGKRVPAKHFLKTAHHGVVICKAALAWDIQCEVFPGIDLASFENGYPDMVAKPLWHTFREVPWRPGSAFLLAEPYTEHGDRIDEAPRAVLQGVLDRANALGYRPLIGAELEFYLLSAERTPLYSGIQCYSLYKGTELEFILREIRLALDKLGIPVEAANPEYGPAQVEINLEYGDALTVADQTVLFKHAVKEIARQHGLFASFMPKPWSEESGNGFHVHQSLWDPERRTNLFDADDAIAQHYLAGLLATAREFLALEAPSVNAYKRYRDHSFAPTNVSWGGDNRTVSTRALLGIGAGSRIEHRTGSSDANPYLIIAANIAAGLYGITHALQPPASHFAQNAYLDDNAALLPGTLHAALELLSGSTAAREFFSERFLQHYLGIGRHEVALFDRAVTDWERARYLEMA